MILHDFIMNRLLGKEFHSIKMKFRQEWLEVYCKTTMQKNLK